MSDLVANYNRIGHFYFTDEQSFEFVERIDARTAGDSIEVVRGVLKTVRVPDPGGFSVPRHRQQSRYPGPVVQVASPDGFSSVWSDSQIGAHQFPSVSLEICPALGYRSLQGRTPPLGHQAERAGVVPGVMLLVVPRRQLFELPHNEGQVDSVLAHATAWPEPALQGVGVSVHHARVRLADSPAQGIAAALAEDDASGIHQSSV